MENERPVVSETPFEPEKVSFLKSWQRRLGLLDEAYPQNGDKLDAPVETKTGKRRQNYFGRIFDGIVRPTPVESRFKFEEKLDVRQAKKGLEETVKIPRDNDELPEVRPPIQEAVPETKEPAAPSSEQAPDKLPDDTEHLKEVLEKVVEAAEHDDPIEIEYERRHEIKDEPKRQSGPTPIGEILKKSNSSMQDAFAAQQAAIAQNNSKSGRLSSLPPMYQQAVKSGFLTALVLIVVIIIVATVV